MPPKCDKCNEEIGWAGCPKCSRASADATAKGAESSESVDGGLMEVPTREYMVGVLLPCTDWRMVHCEFSAAIAVSRPDQRYRIQIESPHGEYRYGAGESLVEAKRDALAAADDTGASPSLSRPETAQAGSLNQNTPPSPTPEREKN